MSDHEGCRIWRYCCKPQCCSPPSLFVGLATGLAPPWQDEYSIRGIYTQSHWQYGWHPVVFCSHAANACSLIWRKFVGIKCLRGCSVAACLFFLVIFHEFVSGCECPPRWLPAAPWSNSGAGTGTRDRVVTAIWNTVFEIIRSFIRQRTAQHLGNWVDILFRNHRLTSDHDVSPVY